MIRSPSLKKIRTVATLPRIRMEKGIRIRALIPTITECKPMGQEGNTEEGDSKSGDGARLCPLRTKRGSGETVKRGEKLF
jgi:hypothetical protein